VTNSTFSGNRAASNSGGGIHSISGMTPTVKNTIIANSTGGNCSFSTPPHWDKQPGGR
jgi:predicted outer membrane repeat protein